MNKFISKERLKTVFPFLILMFMMEVITYFSWTGYYPSRKLILLVCILALFFVYVVDFIPIIHRIYEFITKATISWIKTIPNHRWKRFSIMLFFDGILAFIMERIIHQGGAFNWRLFIWCFSILFIASILVIFRDLLSNRIEITVFLIIMSIGTVYATALPATCGIAWDDETHFCNALKLSHMFDARMTGGDYEQLNSFVPIALEHKYYTLKEHKEWVSHINEADKTNEVVGLGRMFPTLTNLCYLPPAIALTLGRVLHLPYNIIFILGRLGNLLAYALIIYFTIQKAKSCKMLIAVIALMPPNIFMAATYSRDMWMTAWIMYGFAYLVSEIQTPDKLLTIKDTVLILIAFVLGIMPKAVYFPIMLTCLFMPASKFKSKKWHRLYLATFFIGGLAILASFSLPFLIHTGTSGGGGDMRGGAEVAAGSQTGYILAEPFTYAKILFTFLLQYFSFDSAKTFLHFMHYLGTSDYSIITMLLLSGVALTDRCEEDHLISWKFKINTLICSFLCIVLAATSMYIAFTAYKADSIAGCQYRYTFQIFYPVLFVLGGLKFENKLIKNFSYNKVIPQNWYRSSILIIQSFLLLNGLWDLCIKGFM